MNQMCQSQVNGDSERDDRPLKPNFSSGRPDRNIFRSTEWWVYPRGDTTIFYRKPISDDLTFDADPQGLFGQAYPGCILLQYVAGRSERPFGSSEGEQFCRFAHEMRWRCRCGHECRRNPSCRTALRVESVDGSASVSFYVNLW